MLQSTSEAPDSALGQFDDGLAGNSCGAGAQGCSTSRAGECSCERSAGCGACSGCACEECGGALKSADQALAWGISQYSKVADPFWRTSLIADAVRSAPSRSDDARWGEVDDALMNTSLLLDFETQGDQASMSVLEFSDVLERSNGRVATVGLGLPGLFGGVLFDLPLSSGVTTIGCQLQLHTELEPITGRKKPTDSPVCAGACSDGTPCQLVGGPSKAQKPGESGSIGCICEKELTAYLAYAKENPNAKSNPYQAECPATFVWAVNKAGQLEGEYACPPGTCTAFKKKGKCQIRQRFFYFDKVNAKYEEKDTDPDGTKRPLAYFDGGCACVVP